MGTGGEELGNAGRLESSLSESECSAESSTTSSNHHSIICMVDNCVCLEFSSKKGFVIDSKNAANSGGFGMAHAHLSLTLGKGLL